jgi:hypothetical protein
MGTRDRKRDRPTASEAVIVQFALVGKFINFPIEH